MPVTEADINRYIELQGIRLGPDQERLREHARRTLEYRERRREIVLENEAKLQKRSMGMFWKY
jgi:hypothetical protein